MKQSLLWLAGGVLVLYAMGASARRTESPADRGLLQEPPQVFVSPTVADTLMDARIQQALDNKLGIEGHGRVASR
jgi:hypothetical protein